MPKIKKPIVCKPAALALANASRTWSSVCPLRMTLRSMFSSPFSTPKPTRRQPAAFINWNSSRSVWFTFMPCTVTQGTVFSPSSISRRHNSLARGSLRFQMSSVTPISVAPSPLTSHFHSCTTLSTERARQVSPVTGLEQNVHL